ncbi:nucleoside triphosphate pyrophosphohydrolase [Metabacillus fastidiosus]|uniref:nucleoside triphosphate pyrophosphohydrolase n=1 Tax=Metabacillus fastidiosus TaxID=1458 RepID=UPI003D271D51
MPIYNKLVRDKIPEIIGRSGKELKVKILTNDDYIKELQQKSFEELKEYIAAEDRKSSLEELADLLEIIHSLAQYHDTTIDEIEKIRRRKEIERGGFKEKIYLIEVEDE